MYQRDELVGQCCSTALPSTSSLERFRRAVRILVSFPSFHHHHSSSSIALIRWHPNARNTRTHELRRNFVGILHPHVLVTGRLLTQEAQRHFHQLLIVLVLEHLALALLR